MVNRYFKRRYFYLTNVGCTIKIEQVSRKELFDWIDDFTERVYEDDVDGEAYEILYKDGTTDYIDNNYDGHKIRRTNIVSIVGCNCESDIVYGGFNINEYGVVHTAPTEEIDDTVEEVNG